jgi:very-short-patch-repair endonuclease
LARAQHGVVAHWQLRKLGLSGQAIQHRVSIGRLHRVERGIYVVGRPELTRHGRWMAAALGCGPRAMLSHGSAAALFGIGRESHDLIEVSVPSLSPRERPGLRVRRRPKLRASDVMKYQGVPVTVPALTLIDLARGRGDAGLERAVNEADRLDLIDPEALADALDDFPGQPGVGVLRGLLGKLTFRMTDSELERRFLPLVADVGLSIPLTRQHLNGFKVDFYWPALRLVVETDGLRYHRTPAQQARDRIRDQTHLAAGFIPLRFTHWQVRYETGHVRSTLLAVARRLGAGRAA